MTTFSQSDVMELEAGDELDERTNIALEFFGLWADGPWPQPNAWDRLRRLLGLPPPHPSVGNPTAYCGVAWSTESTSVIEDAFAEVSVTYPEQPESVAMCRWIVCEAMDAMGMS